ncbi:FtsX-like permease family protein [Comamonadaceae bacterium OH2545_COT-014]|nr:FtsX-like permease family protein [Comamonadaceae bacterium OH2545_COT-014]
MTPSFLVLGWRSLWRDLRAGELRLLMLAVLLAVAALTTVGFFADRLQAGLQRDARQLLGGDAVVVSDHAPETAWRQQAEALGLQSALTLSFPTMSRAPDALGGASRLVALKAVDTGYPLRGRLRVAAAPGAPDGATGDIPAPGQAWADAALLDALGLKVGDALLLGDATFALARVITLEPDRGSAFMSFAPRVMIHASDLPATGLVQPASRITWRLAVAGPDAAVRQFTAWAQARLQPPATAGADTGDQPSPARGVRLESLDSGRPEMQQTLARAEKFLSLTALLTALLAAVAVALATRAFAARQLDASALLRVLGLPQRTLAGAYATEFLLAGLAASAAGVALGYALHHIFVWLLAGLVDTTLPPPGAWPLLLGLGVGLTLLAAFGLPPVLQLARVPPLRVLRRDVGQLKAAPLAVLGLGMAGFAALLLAVSRDAKLGLIAVGGFAGAALLFALLARGALWLLRRLVHDATAPRWLVLATRQMAARPVYAVVQVSSLAVGLMALVLLVLLRTDLIDGWRQATPADAPNRFVINILPEQGAAFQAALKTAGVPAYDWYPMIRGRLTAINGQAVSAAHYADDRARRLVEREFNLSHAAQRPVHNEVTAGRWLAEEAGAASVEAGLADTLGLKLGDRLTFDIAGMPHEARITSLRKVDWSSLHANFFVMFPVSRMDDVPATWLAAYRAPDTPGFDNALVRQFPNITSVDMSSTLAQVQRVLAQVIRAVEFLFGFTLAAGLVVLFAAVTATREERAREFAIMRALGAPAALLAQVQRTELAGAGLLAGLLASAVASAMGWVMARHVFDFSWAMPFWVPLAGAAAGAALALAAGWWGLREVLTRPVVQTLRQSN